MDSALRLALAALLAAACAGPAGKRPSVVDLRVCVAEERLVESWAKNFKSATAAAPREGRECDVVARSVSDLNADKVTIRSAYDGTVLVELEGPVDFVPRLAAMALSPDTEPYKRVRVQREKSGF